MERFTPSDWISIPTALAGCDITEYMRQVETGAVFQSPQPSRAVTSSSIAAPASEALFQSPQPSRAVTVLSVDNFRYLPYFNPHSPRGL